jgi:hypothetical protein
MNNNSRLISSQMVGEFIFVLFNMIVRSSLFLFCTTVLIEFLFVREIDELLRGDL